MAASVSCVAGTSSHTASTSSVLNHLLPALEQIPLIEEQLVSLIADRERLKTQEGVCSFLKESRAADQAEIATLQKQLSSIAGQYKQIKLENQKLAVQMESEVAELDSLKALLRSKTRDLEDTKADLNEIQERHKSDVLHAVETNNAEWDVRWAAESANVSSKE